MADENTVQEEAKEEVQAEPQAEVKPEESKAEAPAEAAAEPAAEASKAQREEPGFFEVLGKKAQVLADAISDKAGDVADVVKEKTPVVVDAVKDTASGIADTVQEKTPGVIATVKEKSADFSASVQGFIDGFSKKDGDAVAVEAEVVDEAAEKPAEEAKPADAAEAEKPAEADANENLQDLADQLAAIAAKAKAAGLKVDEIINKANEDK